MLNKTQKGDTFTQSYCHQLDKEIMCTHILTDQAKMLLLIHYYYLFTNRSIFFPHTEHVIEIVYLIHTVCSYPLYVATISS